MLINQAGDAELPAKDENAVREYLCISAYLVNTVIQWAEVNIDYRSFQDVWTGVLASEGWWDAWQHSPYDNH